LRRMSSTPPRRPPREKGLHKGNPLLWESDMAASYRAHPLLDPLFPTRQRTAARFWFAGYGSSQAATEAEPYFIEADQYIDQLLIATTDTLKQRLQLQPETREANTFETLLRIAARRSNRRTRYEAQRKLYLGKLLYDLIHCRSVRDGPRHRCTFELLLKQTLWSGNITEQEVEVRSEVAPPRFGHRLLTLVPKSSGGQPWRFRMRRLPPRDGEPAIDVYRFVSRFKGEDNPAAELSDRAVTLSDACQPSMLPQRNGSILSKMIRRGLGDPQMIQDLLGAMFIVGTRRQVYALERRLVQALGGPLRWRDRVDTISNRVDRELLDPHAAASFRVLKEIVDVLIEDPFGGSPYLVPIEIQICPLEAYIGTLDDSDFASHYAYKERQFLNKLLPVLFPSEIYS